MMDNYSASAASNQYARMLQQTRGARDRIRTIADYDDAMPQVVRGYSARNLTSPNVRSGLFARAMRDFATKRARSLADYDTAHQEQMRQYDLNDANYASQFGAGIADLEGDKAREIAEAARQLFAYRSGAA
ncbi:MAG: hypothetical protein [Podoviridae sp. ctDWo9]|nr:MAG: hypothetical protein [Podoviridae sp. ctDWo9]